MARKLLLSIQWTEKMYARYTFEGTIMREACVYPQRCSFLTIYPNPAAVR